MGDNSLMKKEYVTRFLSSDVLRGYASRLSFPKNWRPPAGLLTRRWAGPAILGGVALISLLFIGYGIWLLQLERGARAVERGDLEAAGEFYASAETPLRSLLGRAFPDHYARAVFPQIALLYRRGKTDEAIGKLERAAVVSPSLTERPEYSFWSGNVLLRRALDNTDPEIIVKNLYAAGGHFRKALEGAPDDWDIKYNFELVQYILAEQEREKEKEEARMKSILERIRTVTEPAEKEPPPPEKRG
jgi:tetratricopeptide (TPR) repeat protein